MPHPNGPALDPERVRVGATVRALREAYGLKQDELAEKSAVGRTTLVRIEAGTRPLSPSNAIAIAGVLGVRPIALLNPTAFTDEVDARVKAGAPMGHTLDAARAAGAVATAAVSS